MESHLFLFIGAIAALLLYFSIATRSYPGAILAGMLLLFLGVPLFSDGIAFQTGYNETVNTTTNTTIHTDTYTTYDTTLTDTTGLFLIFIGLLAVGGAFVEP